MMADADYVLCATCNRILNAGDVDVNGNCSDHRDQPNLDMAGHEPSEDEWADLGRPE